MKSDYLDRMFCTESNILKIDIYRETITMKEAVHG